LDILYSPVWQFKKRIENKTDKKETYLIRFDDFIFSPVIFIGESCDLIIFVKTWRIGQSAWR